MIHNMLICQDILHFMHILIKINTAYMKGYMLYHGMQGNLDILYTFLIKLIF